MLNAILPVSLLIRAGRWTTISILIAAASYIPSATHAWQTRARYDSEISGALPIAFEQNTRGDISEVYRDSDGSIILRVKLSPGFIQFSPTNCPTLQIDTRLPVHHYQRGENCELSVDQVDITIGDVVDDVVLSLPLHRLINGNQLAVRFVTASGEYRQASFSLANSKRALTEAVGPAIRIEPAPINSATEDSSLESETANP